MTACSDNSSQVREEPTSNRAIDEWYPLFGDPLLASAAMDRLLHHATVIDIDGQSFRNPARSKLPRRRTPGAPPTTAAPAPPTTVRPASQSAGYRTSSLSGPACPNPRWSRLPGP
ncbi:MAG: ATP-binding protein [Planctomycetota bacterium]